MRPHGTQDGRDGDGGVEARGVRHRGEARRQECRLFEGLDGPQQGIDGRDALGEGGQGRSVREEEVDAVCDLRPVAHGARSLQVRCDRHSQACALRRVCYSKNAGYPPTLSWTRPSRKHMLLRAMTVDVRGASVHCPVLSLVDRRSTRPRRKEWVLTKAVELCLFGPNDVRLQLPVVDIFFAADLFPPHARSARRALSTAFCKSTRLMTPFSSRSARQLPRRSSPKRS